MSNLGSRTCPHMPLEAMTDQRFRQIYESEHRYVWNTLLRLGVRAADVEDVAQETLLTVYKKLDDYDSTRPLKPWLFGFAFRVAADYRKSAQQKRSVNEDE